MLNIYKSIIKQSKLHAVHLSYLHINPKHTHIQIYLQVSSNTKYIAVIYSTVGKGQPSAYGLYKNQQ